MTTPDHPLPQAGGSYIRQPDGQLQSAAAPAPDAASDEPVKPTVKGAVKAPAKEA
ncbi:hypothetical protein [Tabrizicola fusiformis]|uniref:hypothetical protein n=1 Tax=Tabrizicola sp. SY72 TaxID=2741673 RepID=UPI001572A3B9|nr:hypothetical protein [Tabrizicola sp. SY72]NTT88267.1 hypothetical protein [Tabrizicola sp. SY72]